MEEKPKYDDFAVSATDIGAGNFSRVMRARHRASGEVFALKVMEKAKVKRLAVRHKNVNNEIMMEKQTLLRLRGHRNVVSLFHTFSDDTALYFLFEMVDGGELWAQLMDGTAQIGCDVDVARFYLLQLLAAMEHMHSHGVVHRDLKPENVMLTKTGVVKVIDFGTAKDLLDSTYNGPEFVGTAEYMSPEVVNSSEPGSVASDLWAFGCIAFQCVTGRSPFKAPSDYLALRRVQRFDLIFPPAMDAHAASLCAALLQLRPRDRLGVHVSDAGTRIDYEAIRRHPFFSRTGSSPSVAAVEPGMDASVTTVAPPLPSPLWLAMRDWCRAAAADDAGDALAAVPADVAASPFAVQLLRQQLWLRGLLHVPRVQHALAACGSGDVAATLQCARCRCVDAAPFERREVLGLTRDLQGAWSVVSTIAVLALPVVDGAVSASALPALARVVAHINAQSPHPRAVVVLASLDVDVAASVDAAAAAPAAVMEALSGLAPEIVVVPSGGVQRALACGDAGGADATSQSAAVCTHFGFWSGGARGVVLDAMALEDPSHLEWARSELDVVKFGSQHSIVLCDSELMPARACDSGDAGAEHVQRTLDSLARTRQYLCAGVASNVRLFVSPGAVADGGGSAVVRAVPRLLRRHLRRLSKKRPRDGAGDHDAGDGSDNSGDDSEEERTGSAAARDVDRGDASEGEDASHAVAGGAGSSSGAGDAGDVSGSASGGAGGSGGAAAVADASVVCAAWLPSVTALPGYLVVEIGENSTQSRFLCVDT